MVIGMSKDGFGILIFEQRLRKAFPVHRERRPVRICEPLSLLTILKFPRDSFIERCHHMYEGTEVT
jgi:hypothetical protein